MKLPQLRHILVLCWSLDGRDFFSLKSMLFVESWTPIGVLFFLLLRDHDNLGKSAFGCNVTSLRPIHRF